MMLKTLTLGCAALLSFTTLSTPAHAATLAEALSAYRSNRVADAERMLAAVAADPAAPAADRVEAQRELARIDWLIRGETDALAAAIDSATTGPARCSVVLLALRIHREAGDPALGLAEAARARGECTLTDAEAMHIAIARAHLAQATLQPTRAAEHLRAATAELDSVEPIAAGDPAVASTRLSIALARRDAAAAFEAWRDYFWLTETDAPQAMEEYAGRVRGLFNAGLAVNASEADRAGLVDMLVRAGFAEDASDLAGQSDGPLWAKARAYFTFHAAVREATLRANREMANGGGAAWYADAIRAAMGQLLRANRLSGDPRIALAEAYGIFGSVGRTSGYPSLHGGHLVQEEVIRVEQYGRTGEVRFTVIDNMLANGYESWLWDGWAETGGWSSDGNLIVQVRSAYASEPLRQLRRARPGQERTRFLAVIEETADDERSALAGDGVAELPAASKRLELQALDRIAARVGDDDAAFIAEIWRATNQSSIGSHEGRHALDNASEPGLPNAELEFRAKLSEIIFADYPRLGLAAVAGGAQNDTAHGVANRRVLEGYHRWMRRHRDEIVGFNQHQPTLSQLHLLTDAQIVAVARGMDPWAR